MPTFEGLCYIYANPWVLSTPFPDLRKIWWLFLHCKQYVVGSNSTSLDHRLPANPLEAFLFLNEWKAIVVLSKLTFAEKKSSEIVPDSMQHYIKFRRWNSCLVMLLKPFTMGIKIPSSTFEWNEVIFLLCWYSADVKYSIGKVAWSFIPCLLSLYLHNLSLCFLLII